MPYNENIATRLREALNHLPNVQEKKMFGGLAFMINDKMCINATTGGIMCRIDPDINSHIMQNKVCRPVVMKGRELKGYVYVDEENIKNQKELDYWVALSLDFNKVARKSKK